jgi:fatty-acyl-CoA synthase
MGMRRGLAWWDAEPGPRPLRDVTVGEVLAEAAADSPGREAVVGGDVRWTFAELLERADRLAAGLIGLGVAPGDRVAVWAPNVPMWLAAEFGIARAGAILVTANPTLQADEIRYLLSDSEASVCVLLPSFRQFDLATRLARVRDELPVLRRLYALDDLEELEAAGEGHREEVDARARAVESRSVAQIQYTSGTTGRPKGAMLTHRGIANNVGQSTGRWEIGPGDRLCNPLPLFHTGGCVFAALGCVVSRAAHCLVPWFDADLVLDTIERERCTIVWTVPTMLTALLDRQRTRNADLSSLRLAATAGAPTPPALGHACRDEWGVELRVLYGSTESGPTSTGTALDAPGDRGFTTVGPPQGWVDARVVDLITREPVAPGQPGEVELRGYHIMAGYVNRPEATAEAIDADGWFRTGDIGVMDEAGYLSIVDRAKDMVIRGGENLYPAEIEAAIRDHPAVLDVAVVGVPDAYYGEEACAAVVLRGGATLDADGLRGFLRERISHQKIPRYVVPVESLPTTASGKVQKFELRERLEQCR